MSGLRGQRSRGLVARQQAQRCTVCKLHNAPSSVLPNHARKETSLPPAPLTAKLSIITGQWQFASPCYAGMPTLQGRTSSICVLVAGPACGRECISAPRRHTRSIISCVAATIAALYASTAALRKAGLLSRRCRCHTAPSLTSRPFPARLLPGKNAVPSLTYTVPACSIKTVRASSLPVTSTTRSPPSSSPTTGPNCWVEEVRNDSGSERRETVASPDGPAGKPGGGGVASRCRRAAVEATASPVAVAAAVSCAAPACSRLSHRSRRRSPGGEPGGEPGGGDGERLGRAGNVGGCELLGPWLALLAEDA